MQGWVEVQLLNGNLEALLGQLGEIVFPVYSGLLEPPSGGKCLENLTRETTSRHPNQMHESAQAEEQRIKSEPLLDD